MNSERRMRAHSDLHPAMSIIPGACFVPQRTITDANGAPVWNGVTGSRNDIIFPSYLERSIRDTLPFRPGRYLYCGKYFPHFGHFILESMSRLWACDHISGEFDGLVFFNGQRGRKNIEILRIIGIENPVYFVDEPTQFEELVVPEQGMGMGPFSSGNQQQRDFLRERFSGLAKPRENCENIYISRSQYDLRRGGILCEKLLERNLERQGYHIFHPQSEDLQTQVATYLGAKKIISTDNSALHLLGFVANRHQDIAIILRRKSGAVDLFPQLSVAAGREPLIVDAIQRVWVGTNSSQPSWGQYADLSFSQVKSELLSAGFISDDIKWTPIGGWKKDINLNRLMERRRGAITAWLPDLSAPADVG